MKFLWKENKSDDGHLRREVTNDIGYIIETRGDEETAEKPTPIKVLFTARTKKIPLW